MGYLYEAPNITGGIDSGISGTINAVPSIIPLFLFFVWGLVLISGMTSQKRRTGSADMPLWTTIASISVMLISLSLTLTAGFIELSTLSIVAVITIASGFWLFMDRNKNEA